MMMLRPLPRLNSKCPNAPSRALRFGSGLRLGNGGQLVSRAGADGAITGGVASAGAGAGLGGVAGAGVQA